MSEQLNATQSEAVATRQIHQGANEVFEAGNGVKGKLQHAVGWAANKISSFATNTSWGQKLHSSELASNYRAAANPGEALVAMYNGKTPIADKGTLSKVYAEVGRDPQKAIMYMLKTPELASKLTGLKIKSNLQNSPEAYKQVVAKIENGLNELTTAATQSIIDNMNVSDDIKDRMYSLDDSLINHRPTKSKIQTDGSIPPIAEPSPVKDISHLPLPPKEDNITKTTSTATATTQNAEKITKDNEISDGFGGDYEIENSNIQTVAEALEQGVNEEPPTTKEETISPKEELESLRLAITAEENKIKNIDKQIASYSKSFKQPEHVKATLEAAVEQNLGKFKSRINLDRIPEDNPLRQAMEGSTNAEEFFNEKQLHLAFIELYPEAISERNYSAIKTEEEFSKEGFALANLVAEKNKLLAPKGTLVNMKQIASELEDELNNLPKIEVNDLEISEEIEIKAPDFGSDIPLEPSKTKKTSHKPVSGGNKSKIEETIAKAAEIANRINTPLKTTPKPTAEVKTSTEEKPTIGTTTKVAETQEVTEEQPTIITEEIQANPISKEQELKNALGEIYFDNSDKVYTDIMAVANNTTDKQKTVKRIQNSITKRNDIENNDNRIYASLVHQAKTVSMVEGEDFGESHQYKTEADARNARKEQLITERKQKYLKIDKLRTKPATEFTAADMADIIANEPRALGALGKLKSSIEKDKPSRNSVEKLFVKSEIVASAYSALVAEQVQDKPIEVEVKPVAPEPTTPAKVEASKPKSVVDTNARKSTSQTPVTRDEIERLRQKTYNNLDRTLGNLFTGASKRQSTTSLRNMVVAVKTGNTDAIAQLQNITHMATNSHKNPKLNKVSIDNANQLFQSMSSKLDINFNDLEEDPATFAKKDLVKFVAASYTAIHGKEPSEKALAKLKQHLPVNERMLNELIVKKAQLFEQGADVRAQEDLGKQVASQILESKAPDGKLAYEAQAPKMDVYTAKSKPSEFNPKGKTSKLKAEEPKVASPVTTSIKPDELAVEKPVQPKKPKAKQPEIKTKKQVYTTAKNGEYKTTLGDVFNDIKSQMGVEEAPNVVPPTKPERQNNIPAVATTVKKVVNSATTIEVANNNKPAFVTKQEDDLNIPPKYQSEEFEDMINRLDLTLAPAVLDAESGRPTITNSLEKDVQTAADPNSDYQLARRDPDFGLSPLRNEVLTKLEQGEEIEKIVTDTFDKPSQQARLRMTLLEVQMSKEDDMGLNVEVEGDAPQKVAIDTAFVEGPSRESAFSR